MEEFSFAKLGKIVFRFAAIVLVAFFIADIARLVSGLITTQPTIAVHEDVGAIVEPADSSAIE